jgi:hypothetical protein
VIVLLFLFAIAVGAWLGFLSSKDEWLGDQCALPMQVFLEVVLELRT